VPVERRRPYDGAKPCAIRHISDGANDGRADHDQRDFELVNINTDEYTNKDTILAFLKKKEASGSNYILSGAEKNTLITAVDPDWNGKLPYILLVEPGGKIVYTTQNRISLEEMRKMIFNDPLIGRLYK